MSFEYTSAIVTGGASGIGEALVRKFRSLDMHVLIADRNEALGQAMADDLGATFIPCDVTKESDIQAAVERARRDFGSIDMFVSNAGIGLGQPDHAASASNEVWQKNWNVHVMAHVYAARAVVPIMQAQGRGYLVNVASAAGLLNQIGDAAYSATKHAAVSFAESLAIEHKDDGIDVSVVCPQYVATPLLGLSSKEATARESLLTASDVADAVMAGVSAKQFRILSHPIVDTYVRARALDHEAWLDGMRGLRRKAIKTFGAAKAETLYQLV